VKVLVTGHQGFLGPHVVDALCAAGHDVTGLDTGFFVDCGFGASPRSVPTIRADIRDVDASMLEGFDAVAHLAALSNDPLGDLNAQCTYDINQHASVHLARVAKQAGVSRFAFSSSCSLY